MTAKELLASIKLFTDKYGDNVEVKILDLEMNELYRVTDVGGLQGHGLGLAPSIILAKSIDSEQIAPITMPDV